ncbi:fucolectin-related protein [Plakobranchus ocellatus]|uniref:Fucolectin-related protein n=1 Tax=Plakobranchus ocellatus TaxID=259542 RepID=A0AAV3YTS9_9GAST|nr:fucolectin-related protein [Plakobranchus ocellatus]
MLRRSPALLLFWRTLVPLTRRLSAIQQASFARWTPTMCTAEAGAEQRTTPSTGTTVTGTRSGTAANAKGAGASTDAVVEDLDRYPSTAATIPEEGMEATEVTKVRCLGGHMCDRNQLLAETRATDEVVMGAPGDVSMVRFSEVDQLILLSLKLHGNASRAVRDSWNIHRCGFSRMRKWHTNWNPGIHGCEYAQTCTQAGWFGNNCEFQCHCANNAECDRTTGACSNGCDPQWFGPACQYVASEFTLSGYDGNKAILPTVPLDLVLDNDDRTCISENLYTVIATLKTPQPFTWIRVVSNSANLTQFGLSLFKEEGSPFIIFCYKPRFAKVDDRTLDIPCFAPSNIAKVYLNGPIVDGLCSLYINGGRNVALKQRAVQSSTFDGRVASNAVDGDLGVPDDYSNQRSTCSQTLGYTDTSDWWEVTFYRSVKINWFQIYNARSPNRADCCEDRLLNFTMQALQGSDAHPSYSYRDPGGPAQDIYTVVPSPPIVFAAQSVKIDTSRNTHGFLTLCEVLVFGEVTCSAGKFGRQCERDCNCADQTEACFVSTGGCPSGCAAGYTGEDCYTRKSYIFYF